LALGLAAVAVLAKNLRSPCDSAGFIGSLALATAVWHLVVPVLGMLHVLLLIAIVPLLLSKLERDRPSLYRPAAFGLALVYVLGIVAFLWGLQYGKNHEWSALVYGGVGSLLVALLALLLCFGKSAKHENSST
jgi:hypothetical protein